MGLPQERTIERPEHGRWASAGRPLPIGMLHISQSRRQLRRDCPAP